MLLARPECIGVWGDDIWANSVGRELGGRIATPTARSAPDGGGINAIFRAQRGQRPALAVKIGGSRDFLQCQARPAQFHALPAEQSGDGQAMDGESLG